MCPKTVPSLTLTAHGRHLLPFWSFERPFLDFGSILGPFWAPPGPFFDEFASFFDHVFDVIFLTLLPFSLSVSWYLWWVGWIGVVGNLGVVSWWLGGMMMSPVFHPPSLTLSPLRVYKAATQQDSRKRTRQQRNGIVRQSHNKPTRKQRSKAAGKHDNKTATKPPTNPPTN